jgi:hypothetical protein
MHMAQVIEFYVPANHPFQWLWTTEDERGKLIAFPNTTPELSSLTQDEPAPLSRCLTVASIPSSSRLSLVWVAE